jgi:ADP-ribose pyrophosphatase
MPTPYGPWTIKSTEQIYRDPFVELTLDQVIRPDGDDGQHVVVKIKPGVCVIAVDKERNVHLTKEFHYAVGRDSVEAVSGGVEPDENADLTAKRELQEELGLEAESWKFLTTVDPFTTCLVSPTRLYLATGLTEVDTNPEGTEQIEHVVIPLADAAKMVASGEITHAPSCVGILMAESVVPSSSKPIQARSASE